MWQTDDQDQLLGEVFSSLALHNGVAIGAMRAIRREAAYARASLWLNRAAMLLSALSVAFFVASFGPGEAEALSGMLRFSACAGGVLVGVSLSVWAGRWSELDCALLKRVTGASVRSTLSDVILVRAGAVLILLFSGAMQLSA